MTMHHQEGTNWHLNTLFFDQSQSSYSEISYELQGIYPIQKHEDRLSIGYEMNTLKVAQVSSTSMIWWEEHLESTQMEGDDY